MKNVGYCDIPSYVYGFDIASKERNRSFDNVLSVASEEGRGITRNQIYLEISLNAFFNFDESKY